MTSPLGGCNLINDVAGCAPTSYACNFVSHYSILFFHSLTYTNTYAHAHTITYSYMHAHTHSYTCNSIRYQNCWPCMWQDVLGVVLVYNPDRQPQERDLEHWHHMFVAQQGLSSDHCLLIASCQPWGGAEITSQHEKPTCESAIPLAALQPTHRLASK